MIRLALAVLLFSCSGSLTSAGEPKAEVTAEAGAERAAGEPVAAEVTAEAGAELAAGEPVAAEVTAPFSLPSSLPPFPEVTAEVTAPSSLPGSLHPFPEVTAEVEPEDAAFATADVTAEAEDGAAEEVTPGLDALAMLTDPSDREQTEPSSNPDEPDDAPPNASDVHGIATWMHLY